MDKYEGETFHWVPSEAVKRIPEGVPVPFAILFSHGSLKLEIFAPRRVDNQSPHDQDEVYVIVSGHGHFIRGNARCAFSQGDVLFVPAGMHHRFEDFSDDLIVWVIFYGPKGGESPHPRDGA